MKKVLAAIRSSRKKKGRRSRRPPWLLPALAAGIVVGCALFAWGLHALAHSDTLQVRVVEVSGYERVPEEDVRVLIEGQIGQALLFVRLEKLQQRIESIPGIESAVVARRMPDMIQVHVNERAAVARTRFGRMSVLVDSEGFLFPPAEGEEEIQHLPLLQGLSTAPGTIRLVERDLPALRALEALEEVTGREAPVGTTVDLSPLDKIVLRPGHDAPQLWLDRERPARNLQNFFELKGGVAELAPDRSVDLRFPHRLTVVMSQDVATRR